MQSSSLLNCMTELGIANEIGSGKVRWRQIQENLKGPLVSGTGSNLTSIAISSDSEWLAFGRRNHGVSVLKLRGGSGTEISLPLTNSGLGGIVSALYLFRSNGKSYTLYAGDQQGTVVSWHFKDEHSTIPAPQVISTELGGITSITSHLDELYVASKDGVKVVKIDLNSGKVQDEFPLSSSPPIKITCVAKHINSLLVVSQHRHIACFSLNDKTVQYLSGDATHLNIDISPHIWEQEYQHVLSVNELGDVSIWKVGQNPQGKKPLQPLGKIKLDNSSNKSITILNARFSHTHKDTIIVAHGNSTKVNFAEVRYVDNETGIIVQKQTISAERSSLIDNTQSAQNEQGNDSKTPSKKDKKKEESKVRIAGSIDAPVSQQSFKGADSLMQIDSAYPQDQEDIPFGQLVQQQMKRKADTSSNAKANVQAGKKKGLELPRATSAVSALASALATNDKAQLQLILAKHDDHFVTSTLRQLPVSQVLPLLTELLASFSQKASLPVVTWTRQLLIIHQSYLASAPDLLNKLSGLYNTVDDRLQNYSELLKLSGRFDLLLTHVRDDDQDAANGKRALQTYVEEDDDLDMPESDDEEEEEFDGMSEDSDEQSEEDSDSS